MKKGIADVATSKKRLQMQSQKLEQQVVKLDTQARQALVAEPRGPRPRRARAQDGRPDRAPVARPAGQELENQQEQLTENEKKLRAKIEAFRTKKEVIKAQYSAAEAQVKISEAANGVGEEMADLGLAIQRAEDKTEQMRARASAVEELEAAGTFDDLTQLGGGQDDIDRELAQLGAGAQVDDELAKMKAELGSGGGDAPALRRARRSRPVIVRISGEGQFKLPDDDAARLNELDNRAVAAVEQGDETGFQELWSQMLELVATRRKAARRRRAGRVRRDPAAARHELRARLQGEFTGDGLIPEDH